MGERRDDPLVMLADRLGELDEASDPAAACPGEPESSRTPQRDEYDLVVCLYVHVAGSVEEMVQRMATGVARGGTLFLVGHRPIDPATGAATAAAGQVQVAVEATLAALDPDRWELIVADDRPRPMAGTGVDAVIRARRRC